MTSNIGSQEILEAQQRGLSYPELQRLVLGEVRHHVRPEFLIRVDEMVVFHPLTQDELWHIVNIQLGQLKTRLEDRRIRLEVTNEAIGDLALRGYDPVYGARPLKRVIQHDVETALSKLLVKGEVKEGDTVTVDSKDGQIALIPSVSQ